MSDYTTTPTISSLLYNNSSFFAANRDSHQPSSSSSSAFSEMQKIRDALSNTQVPNACELFYHHLPRTAGEGPQNEPPPDGMSPWSAASKPAYGPNFSLLTTLKYISEAGKNDASVGEYQSCRRGSTDRGQCKRRKTNPVEELNNLAQSPEKLPAKASKQQVGRRSQKLGDKVALLQQLVSPYGKTDTASVLYEASTSIKFLLEQIEVLSMPYFSNVRSLHLQMTDLRSRGLCLVPVQRKAEEVNPCYSPDIV